MLVYTVLFTCVGHTPERNLSIPMFVKWLRYLIQYGGLETLDNVVILIDDISKEFLYRNRELQTILSSVPFTLTYHRINQPFSFIEGVVENYTCVPSIFSSYSTNLYIDLSMLVVHSLKPIYSSLHSKNTLLVQEGKSDIFGFVVSSEIIRFFDLLVNIELNSNLNENVFYDSLSIAPVGIQIMIDYGVFTQQGPVEGP